MRRPLPRSAYILWIAAVLATAVARADPQDESSRSPNAADSENPEAAAGSKARAREKFQNARQAHERGRFEEAARLFEAADRISPHASTKFNAAIDWDRAGARARAADAYEAALDVGGLTTEQAREAAERLSTLKKTLGYIRIVEPVGATATVAHLEGATVPVRVHVRPGVQRIVIEEPNAEPQTRSVRIGAGEVKTIAFESRVPASAPQEPPGARATVPPEPRTAAADRETPDPHKIRRRRAWGWACVGASIALSGAAIGLGLSALAARDDFEASARTDEAAHDRAANLRMWTNISWGGAAAFGGTGLGLVLSTPKIEF